MTDNKISEAPPEEVIVDVAYWLLKKASGGKSMWEDPEWDYTKKGGAEFRAAHPAYLNNVPFVHKDDSDSRSRKRNPAGSQPLTSTTNLSPCATNFKHATTSTTRSLSPHAKEFKPASNKAQNLNGYVPPHLRGWGPHKSEGMTTSNSDSHNKVENITPPKPVKLQEDDAPHLRTITPKQATTAATDDCAAIQPEPTTYIPPHLRGWSPDQKPAQAPTPQANSNVVQDTQANSKEDQVKDEPALANGGWPTECVKLEECENSEKDALLQVPELVDKAIRHTSLRSDISLEERVSNVGVDEDAYESTGPKENIRAKQGRDAKQELLNYDGVTWVPPPVDWEYDRGLFDPSFIPAYCKEWASQLPGGQMLDIDDERFASGRFPVMNYKLIDEIEQPDSMPDLAQCENEEKRLTQCSANASARKRIRIKKEQRTAINLHRVAKERAQEIEAEPPQPHPNAPAIEVYFRPALQKDIPGIVSIYNKYIKDLSIIQDDHEPVTEDEMWSKLKEVRAHKGPILVAIKGAPPKSTMRGRKEEFIMPPGEEVIGFAWVEPRVYGTQIARKFTGRSRYTGLISLYVHTQFTRKGIGRCLMDRIMQCTSTIYAGLDGYEWINPKDDQTCVMGGARVFHELIIEYPVHPKEDYSWVKNYVRKWLFLEEARLKQVARSSNQGLVAEWLDIVVFQTSALPAGDFPVNI